MLKCKDQTINFVLSSTQFQNWIIISSYIDLNLNARRLLRTEIARTKMSSINKTVQFTPTLSTLVLILSIKSLQRP